MHLHQVVVQCQDRLLQSGLVRLSGISISLVLTYGMQPK